jgi:hypothetical protein
MERFYQRRASSVAGEPTDNTADCSQQSDNQSPLRSGDNKARTGQATQDNARSQTWR